MGGSELNLQFPVGKPTNCCGSDTEVFPDVAAALECRSWTTHYQRQCPSSGISGAVARPNHCEAIAKWRYDYVRGQSSAIDAKTVIVIDEIGLAGVRELESVLRVAHEAHAKVVYFGDRRQLESVQGGSALRAVADVVARGAVLSQVRRQTVSWQRAASMVMAKGDPEAGLRAYAKNERLELVSGEAGAQARVIQVWNEYRAAHGDDVLMVTRRNDIGGV
jgi:ATP-dependent exoDNAse (exonuclease V) alpha subunit